VNAEVGDDPTRGLMDRWNAGDETALEQLLQLHGDWLRHHVRVRLGPAMRSRLESMDIVQDTLLEFFKSGPRFIVENAAQFRGLMSTVIENRIRDRRDWFSAQCRAMQREERHGSIADLSVGGHSRSQPDTKAAQNEWEAFVRLAVMLLDPDDRDIIVLRQWQDLQFDEIGKKLGIEPDAARMRFNRALPRLAARVDELRRGKV
jgi:RNA polymerase sigma-70 factor, ECF subfamily